VFGRGEVRIGDCDHRCHWSTCPSPPRPAKAHCENVLLTAKHAFASVNILDRLSIKGWYPHFRGAHLPGDRHSSRRRRRRFWIEPNFRAWFRTARNEVDNVWGLSTDFRAGDHRHGGI